MAQAATAKKAENWKPTTTALKEIVNQDLPEMVKHFTINYTMRFTEDMLGTVPRNKEIYKKYIATKKEAESEEEKEELEAEAETVDESEFEGHTGFHKDDEGIFIYNYMLLGNIKANIKILNDNEVITKVTSYKKICDLFLIIEPRKIRFYRDSKIDLPDGFKEDDKGLFRMGEALYSMEHPVRAMTAKGERTFITRADFIRAGTKFDFTVKLLKNRNHLTPVALMKAMKYSERHGLGQWRGSGGYGAFKIESFEIE